MANEEGHVTALKGETLERLEISLDRLEQKYEQALQEWERASSLEKVDAGPIRRRKRLPKRLPKLNITNGTSDDELPDQGIREQLIQVLNECEAEEAMVSSLESTLEIQNKNLESNRNQQHKLQKQLQTILHEKEELQKLIQKVEIHLKKTAPVVENAERRLADNAEILRKIDEDFMRIRKDAVELLQVHQGRQEVEEQVEVLSSSITAIQEQKAAALERMRDSQEEENKLYRSMKDAIKKVCVQHNENILELERRYEILWLNVDCLLDFCNDLLQQTRPEVLALKVGTHHQKVKFSGAQPNVFVAHADTRGNNLKVTHSSAQPDVQVSESQTALHGVVLIEGVSSESQYTGTYLGAQLACVNTVDESVEHVLCKLITTEGSVGDSPAAYKQIPESVDVHSNVLPQDQAVSGHNKHSSQELFNVKPVNTGPSGNSSSLPDDIYSCTNTIHQNDKATTDKVPVSQGCNTAAIFPPSIVIYMQSKSHTPPSSVVHTLGTCHIESITINEPTLPLLSNESHRDKDTVLVIDEVDEKAINVCTNHTENITTELKCNIITKVGSPVLGYLPQNAVIIVTEGKPLETSPSVPHTLNQPTLLLHHRLSNS